MTENRFAALTMEDLNEMEVNRRAREMILRAGLAVDVASLHIAQLALWALDGAGVEVETDVGETLRAMIEWRPVRIANFFQSDLEDAGFRERCRKAGTPLALARVVLDEIDRKVYLHFPCYLSGD
jgi:hypothetical protein